MWETIRTELIYLWYYCDVQIRQIFWYWLAGILIGSFVSVFLKKYILQWMEHLKGKKIGFLGTVIACLLGILSPLCMYGTIPIVASLSEGGMREDWIGAFMMASILMNPQLFIYSLALGTQLAVIRLVVSILGGILAGVLIHYLFKKRPYFNFEEKFYSHNHDTDPNPALRYLKNVGRNVKVTLPYFLIGIGLTALYQRYVPTSVITKLFHSNIGLGSLLAAGLGVPLYTCGGGTIPLISQWLMDGMSKGSAVSFMIAGPGTKLTNLGALKSSLGIVNFILYIVFAIVFAALSGVVVDLIF